MASNSALASAAFPSACFPKTVTAVPTAEAINAAYAIYRHQLVRNQDIQKLKEKDPEIEQKVVTLIKEEKIPKAQDVRLIGDVYKHKKARKRVFNNKEDITPVYFDLKAKAPMTDSPFMKDIEGLVMKTKELTREQREGLKKNKRDCSKIEQLTKELIHLCRELDVKIHVPKKLRK